MKSPVSFLLLLVLLFATLPATCENAKGQGEIAVFFTNGTKLPPGKDNALFSAIIVAILTANGFAVVSSTSILKLLGKGKNDGQSSSDKADTQKILKIIRKNHPYCKLLLPASVTSVSFNKMQDGDDDPLLPIIRYVLVVEYSFSSIDMKNGKCIDRINGSQKVEGFLSEKDNSARDREVLRFSLLQEALAKAGSSVAAAARKALCNPVKLLIEKEDNGNIEAIIVSGKSVDVKVGSEFEIFENDTDKNAAEETKKGTALVVRVEDKRIYLKVTRGKAKTGYIMRARVKR